MTRLSVKNNTYTLKLIEQQCTQFQEHAYLEQLVDRDFEV